MRRVLTTVLALAFLTGLSATAATAAVPHLPLYVTAAQCTDGGGVPGNLTCMGGRWNGIRIGPID